MLSLGLGLVAGNAVAYEPKYLKGDSAHVLAHNLAEAGKQLKEDKDFNAFKATKAYQDYKKYFGKNPNFDGHVLNILVKRSGIDKSVAEALIAGKPVVVERKEEVRKEEVRKEEPRKEELRRIEQRKEEVRKETPLMIEWQANALKWKKDAGPKVTQEFLADIKKANAGNFNDLAKRLNKALASKDDAALAAIL